VLFTGRYEHSIDTKQRLAIPRVIRERLHPDHDGTAFYACIMEGPTLCLYTEREFERRARELDDPALETENVLEYEEVFYPLSERLELDGQGRIRLPDHLMEIVELGKDVVLIGMKDHMQIRDREQWRRSLAEKLQTQSHLLMNPRRLRARNRGSDAKQNED